jgi:hypothetical protein
MVHGMDDLAICMRMGMVDDTDLDTLIEEVRVADPYSPPSYVASAVLALVYNLNRRALELADVALSKDPLYVNAHMIKGIVHLQDAERAESLAKANKAFHSAYKIMKTIDVYSGLLQVCCLIYWLCRCLL